jgi:hypothetical protein
MGGSGSWEQVSKADSESKGQLFQDSDGGTDAPGLQGTSHG